MAGDSPDAGVGWRERFELASAGVHFRTKITAVWVGIFVVIGTFLWAAQFDWPWMWDKLDFIAKGLQFTMYMAVGGIVLAFVLAVLGALARISSNPLANGIASFYTSFFRGTPLIVQMFLIYLALPQVAGNLRDRFDLSRDFERFFTLDAALAGTLALGLNYGAYMTEIFRAGIQSVSSGQGEAADALGMTYLQKMRKVVLPQALRVIIPPDRERVHRDDEGHRARLVPRSHGRQRGDLPALSAGRQGRPQRPRSIHRRRRSLLVADGDLQLFPGTAREPARHRLRAR